MAKNGKQYTKIAGTWEQIKPSYTDLVDVPTDFNPTAHDHTLSEITDAGTVAAINTNASTTQFLRGDGTWATPADSNTTYTAGSGLSLTGTVFANTAPDQTVSLTGSGATTVTGTYPNFTISSTDNNTTYTLGSFGITATSTELNYTDGVTSAIQTQLNAKAPLASPALTGTPTAPTASSATNNTQIATTAFVTNKLAGVAGGLNFAGSISLSTAKNGDELAAAGLTGPGDYLIVTATGNIQDTGTFVPLAVQAPGDEGDSTLPVTLETGDWIVYVNGTGGTMTVAIINNTDTRFAPTTHTHTIANVTGLQTAIDGKVAKAGDTMTGDLQVKGSGSSRAVIKLVSTGNVPNDLYFGANNVDHWSLTSRDSTNPFLGLYNAVGSPGWAWQISNSTNVMNFYANPTVNGNTVWHAGNDGAGSGLDADLLDGYGSSTSSTASTVVLRDANAYIRASYYNSSRGDETSAAASYIYDSGDGWMRKKTTANARAELVTSSAVTTALGYTPLSTSGKAADSNLLDGIDSSSFLRSDTADTASGKITFATGIARSAHNTGFLEGSYNNVGANSTQSNPIYVIGSSYIPSTTTLSNMYGIGYTANGASFINFTGAGGWGMYVAADGDARVWLDGSNGVVSSVGEHYVGSNRVFHDGYHPNADTLTTARTINGTSFNGSANIETSYWGATRTLTIGNTGKTVNGSGNQSWSLAEIGAAASSHTHDDRYYTESEADGRFLNASGDTATGQIAFRTSGIGLERNYANNGIWFNSGADTNHILWNDYYGGPTTRGAAESGFDGIKWNTYRGIHIRGGSAGSTNIIVAENSSGATADHRVKLYASGAEKLSTNTWGVAVTGDLEINGETAWNGGNLGFSLSGTTLTITTS